MRKQEQIIEILKKDFEETSIFERTSTVLARMGKEGERVTTVKDSDEKNKVVISSSDYVVRNSVRTSMQYIVKEEKFQQRYELIEELKGIWDRYKAKGKCKALLMTKEVLNRLGAEEVFRLESAWGETMDCYPDDYLVTPDIVGDISEVYRIGHEEFEQTYQLVSRPEKS